MRGWWGGGGGGIQRGGAAHVGYDDTCGWWLCVCVCEREREREKVCVSASHVVITYIHAHNHTYTRTHTHHNPPPPQTQHEKIIRGCAIGLALIMYGREEGAETLIEQMTRDQDPLIRYGGMYTIGLAYRGTGNNAAIQKLLHYAVSDVSDDVRRAAVTNLGFVLANAPQQCPRIVALLAESFNPHVRYVWGGICVGVCAWGDNICVGICSG